MTGEWLRQLFSPPADPSLLTVGVYDPWMVALSVTIAIFSSWMGLQIAGQASANRAQRSIVLLTGSLALGSGVWAMHFVGMLAFDLCTTVEYNKGLTLLSLLPSAAASFVALTLIGRKRLSVPTLLGGGVMVGAGIGAMHYTGMAAMRMPLELRYDPWMFALSILVAVVLATLALWVRFGLVHLKVRLTPAGQLLLAATVMGCAIAGMHYTGMAAARFVGVVPPGSTGSVNSAFLALAISLITVAFTVFVVAANALLRYRQLFLELKRSESWMRALLTTTADGVVTIGPDGAIEEFNASAERIFGWQRSEVLGKPITVLIPGHASDDVSQVSEVMAVRKDGREVPIRRALGHAALAERRLSVCFITDISERRAMVQALRDSERQFRSLIANIPGISYRAIVGTQREVAFISDAVERLTGYPASDFTGSAPLRRFVDLVHEDDRSRYEAVFEHAVASQDALMIEYRLAHANGSLRWMWENATVVRAEDGSPHWIDGVVLDMTERHQMEQALREAKDRAEQAAAARATFVANMSHEIRTPMNAILGFTDVLLDSPLDAEQRRQLDTVRSSGRALLRLLNEILDTAKLEKGAVELETADYHLLALVDELSSTLGASAHAKGLTLDVHYDPSLPACVKGDELRVRQVLTNLLDNAIKFTARGSVTLAVTPLDGMLHFSIADTGIGIAPSRMQAIFDPFTQADASMTRRYGGTGLGTTISKQLVELMGGKIWAESVEGEGTTFHILLPLRRGEITLTQARAHAAAALPALRVLAADDVAQNLELLQVLLTRRGHTLDMVRDGAAAVRHAATRDYDVILMDVQMPVLDGLDATRAIRDEARLLGRPWVPIIAMTASVLDEHRRASAEAGMSGFVTKPVDWFALSHEIARVLGLGDAVPGDRRSAPRPDEALDYMGALRRWGGEEAGYREALEKFRSEFADAGPRWQAFAPDHRAELGREAHRVRGVAANLGLAALATALAELERTAAQDAAPECMAALENARSKLGDAINAIERLPSFAPAPPEVGDVLPVADAAAVLERALARGAIDDAALASLQATWPGPPASMQDLRDAIHNFDFDRARAVLNAMLRHFPPQESA